MSEIVEAALQAWTAELDRLWPDARTIWPDDWSGEEQRAVRTSMNAAIKAATTALRAENERLREVMNDVLTFSNDPAVIKMVRAELIKDAPQ